MKTNNDSYIELISSIKNKDYKSFNKIINSEEIRDYFSAIGYLSQMNDNEYNELFEGLLDTYTQSSIYVALQAGKTLPDYLKNKAMVKALENADAEAINKLRESYSLTDKEMENCLEQYLGNGADEHTLEKLSEEVTEPIFYSKVHNYLMEKGLFKKAYSYIHSLENAGEELKIIMAESFLQAGDIEELYNLCCEEDSIVIGDPQLVRNAITNLELNEPNNLDLMLKLINIYLPKDILGSLEYGDFDFRPYSDSIKRMSMNQNWNGLRNLISKIRVREGIRK